MCKDFVKLFKAGLVVKTILSLMLFIAQCDLIARVPIVMVI